jgi:hypothetical protein
LLQRSADERGHGAGKSWLELPATVDGGLLAAIKDGGEGASRRHKRWWRWRGDFQPASGCGDGRLGLLQRSAHVSSLDLCLPRHGGACRGCLHRPAIIHERGVLGRETQLTVHLHDAMDGKMLMASVPISPFRLADGIEDDIGSVYVSKFLCQLSLYVYLNLFRFFFQDG